MTKVNSDLKVAKAIMNGNEKIFNEFFKDSYPRVFRFILGRVNGDKDLADDMAQMSLCKAMDKMHTYRGEAGLFTWVCQISRSMIYAHFLKENRRGKVVQPLAESEDARQILDTIAMSENTQPENIIQNQELKHLISEVLDYLPNNYGDILEWKYVEQLSVKEIASKLNTNMVAVQSSLARARNSFKTVISQMLSNDKLKNPLNGFLEN